MPLIDIHVIEGVFNETEKQNMISKVTDTIYNLWLFHCC